MENGGSGLYVTANNKHDLEAVKAGLQAVKAMRLGLYALAAVFAVCATVVILFAPEGREITSGIVTIALCLLAAGSAGYGTLGLTTPIALLEARRAPNAKLDSTSPQSN